MLVFVICCLLVLTCGKKAPEGKKPDWAKKDIRDFSDADLERLLAQWEEDEEPIPADELPVGHPDKPEAPIDFTKLDMHNPESMLKMTKKGKTVMMFVRVNKFVDKQETEQITSLWQTGLFNNHVQCERFLIEDDRVLFMFQDGSVAWDAKDFLIEQERCEDVQLEQKTYLGKYCVECITEETRMADQEAKKKGKKEDKSKSKKEDKSKSKKKDKSKDEL